MKTLRNYLPLLWQVVACTEDNCFYLVKTKKGLKWKDINDVKSNKDFVVSKNLKKLRKIINSAPKPPKECNAFDFNNGYPYAEDDPSDKNCRFWLTSETYFREDI